MDHARSSAGPVVVAANWYAFRSREHIVHPCVMSECYLWVLEGAGVIRSRGEEFRMTAGTALRLPWGHDVEYRADRTSPFRLGTVHVVPRYDHGAPVVPLVAHLPGDPLLEDPARSGTHGSAVEGPGADLPLQVDAFTGVARRLADLGRYVVERYTEAAFDEQVFRALGDILVAEGAEWAGVTGPESRAPTSLGLMTAYVTENLRAPLRVADVAAAGGCSTSTAQRLFVRHLGSSVTAWVRSARMQEAATLLRTTGLRVGEVARLVGYEDQLYFSRVFRARFSVPPSAYAADSIRP
ncbi:AraC family transcriptional regulator [Brachybacterium sp. FME24]|uniref:helix-turn-helix transcriptional regulator n=1 Tax=Brachybacterium sp. FME24 TaxID=2742605 RepID=UPI0018694963|nr:AraC family transcriptional regulator [Brachybacterium sp. FME24]